jgi:hypothetical protein
VVQGIGTGRGAGGGSALKPIVIEVAMLTEVYFQEGLIGDMGQIVQDPSPSPR